MPARRGTAAVGGAARRRVPLAGIRRCRWRCRVGAGVDCERTRAAGVARADAAAARVARVLRAARAAVALHLMLADIDLLVPPEECVPAVSSFVAARDSRRGGGRSGGRTRVFTATPHDPALVAAIAPHALRLI